MCSPVFGGQYTLHTGEGNKKLVQLTWNLFNGISEYISVMCYLRIYTSWIHLYMVSTFWDMQSYGVCGYAYMIWTPRTLRRILLSKKFWIGMLYFKTFLKIWHWGIYGSERHMQNCFLGTKTVQCDFHEFIFFYWSNIYKCQNNTIYYI